MENTIYSFGYWLQRRRKAHDLTQSELAQLVGCAPTTIRKIEADERRPSKQLAELLAQHLNIPATEIPDFLKAARGERRVDRMIDPTADLVWLDPRAESTAVTSPTSSAPTSSGPLPLPAAPAARVDLLRSSSLPMPPTPLVGRQSEVAKLSELLAQPDCRLLTIIGVGGIGKTRLAIQIGHLHSAHFSDGVFFVSLVAVTSGDFFASTIGDAVGLTFKGGEDPKTQLLSVLRTKVMLLILDNMEHLLDNVAFVLDLLQGAPNLKVLVTSRERLNVQAEWVFELQGLPPPPLKDFHNAASYSATALFVQCAQRVSHTFQLTPQNAPSVIRICQLVAGLPLGIELAASWVQVLTCEEILHEIEQSLDFLSTTMRNVDARHRSLRAVFEHSWRLLSATEQAAFQRLAVFANSFTADAARVIAGVRLNDLLALSSKSLLQIGSADTEPIPRSSIVHRYKIHDALQHYAQEKLVDVTTAAEELRNRHCEYYCKLVGDAGVQMQGAQVGQALTTVATEIDNIRAAWRHAVLQMRIDCLEQALPGMARYYLLRGPLHEGQGALEQTVDKVRALTASERPPRLNVQVFLAKAMVVAADFLNESGRYTQAVRAAQEAVSLAQATQQSTAEAAGYLQWGIARHWQGEYVAAQQKFEQAMAMAKAAGLRALQADSYRHLGRNYIYQADYQTAQQYLEQAVRLYQELGNLLCELKSYNLIGLVHLYAGDYLQARYYYERCMNRYRELGDQPALGWALNNLGAVCTHLGNYECARAYFEQCLAIKRHTSDRNGEGVVLANLSLLAGHLGDIKMARSFSDEAIGISREFGERDTLAYALLCQGHAYALTGDAAAAINAYQEALDLRRTLGQTSQSLEPLAGLAQVALDQGSLAEAQARVEEILAHLNVFTFAGIVELMRVYLTCYRVLRATQDPRAAEVLAMARQVLGERSAKISDVDLRCSYLENVAAHREIMVMSEE